MDELQFPWTDTDTSYIINRIPLIYNNTRKKSGKSEIVTHKKVSKKFFTSSSYFLRSARMQSQVKLRYG